MLSKNNKSEDNKIKVLYIAGWGRSGSTFLHNIIGEIEGFFSIGEIKNIWNLSMLNNRSCGCGLEFGKCGLWGDILNRAYGGREMIDAEKMYDLRRKGAYLRHIPLMMMPPGRNITKK